MLVERKEKVIGPWRVHTHTYTFHRPSSLSTITCYSQKAVLKFWSLDLTITLKNYWRVQKAFVYVGYIYQYSLSLGIPRGLFLGPLWIQNPGMLKSLIKRHGTVTLFLIYIQRFNWLQNKIQGCGTWGYRTHRHRGSTEFTVR